MRILIAEDEPGAAAAMAWYLELQGHTVRTARDGRTALAAAERLAPQVLIADWRLEQDMDGVALARELRRRRPGVRTILVSAYPRSALERAAADLPGATILSKPLKLAELAALVGDDPA